MLSMRNTTGTARQPALCVVALVLCARACLAITADQVVKRAMDLNEGIRDYRAQVTITTIAEKLDIPPRQVTIYYKRPDKMRVDSDQIAMVPRAAVNMHTLGSVAAKNSRASARRPSRSSVDRDRRTGMPTTRFASSSQARATTSAIWKPTVGVQAMKTPIAMPSAIRCGVSSACSTR